jgi:hypothetical protein
MPGWLAAELTADILAFLMQELTPRPATTVTT